MEKTASPEEIRQLREWIALSEENANYFQEIRNIWEVTTPAVDPEKIDTGKALAKVKNRIHTTPQAPVKRTRLITYCRRIAAILLLPAIIAVVALLMKKDRLAPSACNAQPWKFVVVTDHELASKVGKAAAGLGMNKFAKDAPVHILVVEESANITG